MNNYPSWWCDTLTIYNKFEDPQTRRVTWFKTVLTDCFWKYTGLKITVGSTVISTDATICRIPVKDNFKDRYDWQNLPNDEMSNYFTLAPGDILLRGEVDEEIDEYTAGKRSTDFLTRMKKSRDCIRIDHYSVNTGFRGNEHYYITGA